MKKNCILKISCFSIWLSLSIFGCTNQNTTNKSDNGKNLEIRCLAIKADYENYFVPGQNVEIYARSNKKRGVSYAWEVPGEWTESSDGVINWTVPNEAGTYKVTVTAKDSENASVSRSMDITVLDDVVAATPDTFSCKSTTKVTTRNKLVDEDVHVTTSEIKMKNDGTVYIETVESDGETTRTFADSEALYSVDEKGERSLVATRNKDDSLGIPAAEVLSLRSLKAACSEWETDGRKYTFRQANDKVNALVEYDSTLGVVTRIRSESEDDMEVSDIHMEYEVIDGYIVPTYVSGVVEYVYVGETFKVFVEQYFTDIIINE